MLTLPLILLSALVCLPIAVLAIEVLAACLRLSRANRDPKIKNQNTKIKNGFFSLTKMAELFQQSIEANGHS